MVLNARELSTIRRGLPQPKLTPIPCMRCGWVGSGRWARG